MGQCTPGACGQCEIKGAVRYCTECNNKPMNGVGVNRRCEGGKVIEGCDRYESQADGKIYCSSCASQNNYQFVLDLNDSTANKCVKCDRSKNYMKGDVCTPATKVKDCARYELHKDHCKECAGDLAIGGNKNICVKLGKNCSSMTDTVGVCASCLTGFHLAEDKKSCHKNIANCARAADGEDTQCKTCMPGYFLNDKKTCDKINVKHCDEATKADVCTSCFNGYFLKDSTTCVALEVKNCDNSDKTKVASKCDVCKHGFFMKEDNTACTAMPSCMPFQAVYANTIKCVKCNVPDNYYATDVKGSEQVTFKGDKKWQQVCTKAAKIIATTVVALAMVANF